MNAIPFARQTTLEYLQHAGIILTLQEEARIEVADFGLGALHESGLQLLTYINTERVCAKELVLFPGQTCPEHRRLPPDDADAGIRRPSTVVHRPSSARGATTAMNTISFMTANFVARQLDYNMTGGWGQGDRAANDYFRPVATFGQRFEAMLQEIVEMDFDTIDLWLAHLNPEWATEEHEEIARELLQQYGLSVASLAGWLGATPEEFERCCRLAVEMNCTILGGSTSILEKDRPFAVAALEKYGLRLGLENHPEKTPQVMLDKIGDGAGGAVGVTVDTGWFGAQGYDAAQAIRELSQHVVYVHLKDVRAQGMPHETCAYGEGIVPVAGCVRALHEIGYEGPISLEHEPEQEDPRPAVIASRAKLKEWLQYV